MTSLNPDCTLCDLHRSAQVVCVKGSGPSPCDIMIIGEAPSFRRSDQTVVPFSRQSGKLLFQLLQEVGISSDQCYITNVVHCPLRENQTPSTSEVKACMEYLLEEIDQVKPQYVLLLGATALKGVLRKGKITQIHGTFIEKDGITYLPTFHPAAVLRDPSKMDLLRSDLRKFAQLTLGYDPTLAHELSYVVITSLDQFNACLDDLRQSPAVAFDLETSGLDMFEDGAKIHCLGLATLHGTQWILPMSPFDEGEPIFDYATQKMMIESLAEVLSSRKVIGHNAKFDNKWLRVIFGVRFPLTFDTMIAAHLLDENISAGLKYQAKIHFNAPDYDLSTSEKKGNVDPSRLYKYCAYDVYFTALLYQKFKSDLNNDPALKKVFMWLMMPAVEVFEEIELNGVFVNREKMSQLEKELRARLDDLKAKLESLAPGINWNSPKQVGDVLYNQWGIAPLEYTKKGLPSTAEPVLQRLKNLHPGVNTLLEYREVHKQLSGFIEGWHRFIHGDRMHPNFRLTGTVTGRLSCSEPNLQQVPRDPKIRSLITAPPGWTFVEADYSQIELRVAAMLSGDPMMIDIFNREDGDIHTTTAIA
ncbi:DNA polymerase, partial [Candidatus Darwinibacter acetoxidans]